MHALEEKSEEELMKAYIAGDKLAFEQLFYLIAPRIRSFFIRKVNNPTLAEDLTQLTFLKVHKARHRYIHGAPFRPWIFTIATNIHLDELKRAIRKKETSTDFSQGAIASCEALSQKSTAADAFDEKEQAKRVQAAIKKLPESQQVVVQLHRFEQFTYPEIAGMLGMTVGAIKLKAFRAYASLRKELSPLMEGRA